MNTIEQKKQTIEKQIIETLKTVYDPEIPVNIWELGLIYKIEVDNQFNIVVDMTLTAPNCPMAEDLVMEVDRKLRTVKDSKKVKVNLTFDPPWYLDLMSEEAKLELGFL
jgi:FeS assembly SUF system protein